MRDAGAVRPVERLADLNRDRQGLVYRQRAGRRGGRQRLALEDSSTR